MNSRNFLVSKRRASGFTLIEVVVALGVFSLMMTTVSLVFSSGFVAFRNNIRTEKDLENAQFLMAEMAKELRSSTVISPIGEDRHTQTLKFFDHAQAACVGYRQHLDAGNLCLTDTDCYIEKSSVPTASAVACRGTALFVNGGPSEPIPMTTGRAEAHFLVTSSDRAAQRAGFLTINIEVRRAGNATLEPIRVQTGVSLRDYGNFLP